MPQVITDNLDLWTSALLTKATAGRGSNGKLEAYGIEKLRELILELAVRGKLVPQDPNDEPASELLKVTILEKKRLITEEVIRETKATAFPNEPPEHPLPGGWVWTNLYEIGEIGPRNDADDNVEASFVPMQLISEDYGIPVQHEVKQWGEIKTGFTHFKEEDVVLAKITPCFQNGKSAVMRGLTNGLGAGTTELHVYRSINACTVPEYVLIYLKSPRFIGDGIPKMTGTAGQKRITRDYFSGNHFPLPPLAEQHRIVAKVDELMALCDQLEQQQTHSIEAHQTLVKTLLGTLTRVASQQELTEAWTRIASHFDTLFTTEHSIDQLKQTILQLAVMGKLVSQDPNDEPANVLLERVAKAKGKLVEEGVIRKQDPLPDIENAETPFALPAGWSFVRLGDLSKLITKGSSPKWQGVSYTDNSDDVLFVTSENVGSYVLLLDNKKYVEKKFNEVEPRSILEKGDFLMNIVGASIGRTAIYDIDVIANINQAVCLIRIFSELLDCKYLLHFFNSAICVSYMFDKQVDNARANLSMGNIARFVLPLPPLAEQHRIVAKVDELMVLCDALKARINDAQTTQIHLADAIVEQASA